MPNIAAVANRIVSIKSLAQSGVGIAFLNKFDIALESAAKTRRYIPLANTVQSKLSIVAPMPKTIPGKYWLCQGNKGSDEYKEAQNH